MNDQVCLPTHIFHITSCHHSTSHHIATYIQPTTPSYHITPLHTIYILSSTSPHLFSCIIPSPILIHSCSVTSSTSFLFLLSPLLHPFFHLYSTLLYSFFHLYSTLYCIGHLYEALSVECQKSEEKLYKIKRARTGDILGE